MNTFQILTKNIGSLFVSQILSYILAFTYTIYLVRYLGVENYGILSFALALTSIIGIFTDFGLNTLMTREVAKNKSLPNKYLNNIFSMKLILIFIVVILTSISINVLGFPKQTIFVVYLLLIFLIFSSFSGIFISLFQAYEKLEYQSIGGVFNSLLMLIGIVILIYYNFGLIIFLRFIQNIYYI